MVNFSVELLQRVLFSLPYIAIWIAGISFCIHFRKNNPQIANLFIAAFVIFIVHLLATSLLQTWLIASLRNGPIETLTTMLSILQIVGVLVNLIGWVLILVAIYQVFQNKKPAQ